VICAPIYSSYDGLSTQVRVGIAEGLKHDSSIHCDELISISKSVLTNFIGSLPRNKITELNEALKVALDLG
jgi:mRNA interferase MazF